MEDKTGANQFSLAEDALLMSIVKRWTNVVNEENSDVVTTAEKMKAWKKIEQTFNNMTVDGNKGYRAAEVLKVRSEHLERLKNRRELMQNLASGEGNSVNQKGSSTVVTLLSPEENPKSKHERKDDGDGNTTADDASPQTDTSNENDLGQDFLQLIRLREKLLRKEIKLRIEHSKLIFEKEMEILEIKKKNLMQHQIMPATRVKAKRDNLQRVRVQRQKPCWGQSVASVASIRVDESKKLQSNMGKRQRKKVSKAGNVRGTGRAKRAICTWGRQDEGATDNDDLPSLTDEDRRVKLKFERSKTKTDNEGSVGKSLNTELKELKMSVAESIRRNNEENNQNMALHQDNSSASEA